MPTSTALRARPDVLEGFGRLVPRVGAFLAGGGPVVLLGFSRGGYPVEVVAGYGVALWWLLAVGFATNAIPRPRPTRAGWVAIASLALLVVWGLISLTWSENPERGLTEVVRLVVAAGSLLLGMSAVRSGNARWLLGGVFAGLSLIVSASALSRLQPALFDGSNTTGSILGSNTRTSWPLNYWNAVGAAGAVAVAIGVAMATQARTAWTSALSVGPVPVLALGMAFTLSRGGIVAVGLALLAGLLFVRPRLVFLRTLVAPAAGAALLIGVAYESTSIGDALGDTAHADDGIKVLVLAATVTIATMLVQAGLATADEARWTPRLPRLGRRSTVSVVAILLVSTLGAAIAAGLPDRADRAWTDFKAPSALPAGVDPLSPARLNSVSSGERYQMWSGAADAVSAHPIKGIGLGSWESWWNPQRGETGFVRNAHSEVAELAAELGFAGFGLFGLVLLSPTAAFRPGRHRRRRDGYLSVAAPGTVAFVVAVCIDWNWQIGALMVAGMMVVAIPLSSASDGEDDPGGTESPQRMPAARGAFVAVAGTAAAVLAIGVLALALVAPQAVNSSREDLARGDIPAAAARAAEAAGAVRFASSPATQLALAEERAGRLPQAAEAAREAARRTPRDWRSWFLIARIAAARDRPTEAVAAFRRARRLNPNSTILGVRP